MKLTKDKFEKTIAKIVIKERPRQMAYEIIVNGRTSEDVGNEFNVTRQTAHKSALRVWKLYLKSINCPDGWTSIELMIPPELKSKFEEIQKDLLTEYSII